MFVSSASRSIPRWIFLFFASCVWGGCGATSSREASPGDEPSVATSEVRAPDLLDLSLAPESSPDKALVDVVVRPETEGTVELEIVEPAELNWASGTKRMRLEVKRGETPVAERLQIDLAGGRAKSLLVQLRVLNASGEPTLVISRALELGKAETDPAAARVPVVTTLPDGGRIVEYLTPEEAARRAASASPTPPGQPPIR